MMQIIKMILTSSLKELLNLLSNAIGAVKEFFCYKNVQKKDERLKEKAKQKEKFDKKVDDVVDKGTLDDLFNLRNTTLTILVCLFLQGCSTIEVQTTKCWEGHFYTDEDAKAAISNIKLDKKQSVWILSNDSLKRVLKDCK